MQPRACHRSLSALVAILSLALAGRLPAADRHLEYDRDIRPILSNNCFQCHGPDRGQRKAELRLDVRDVALQKKAIVPGKPDESKLVERIFAQSSDDVMPPPESNKTLDAQQKAKLRQWVLEGAPYAAHWAYVPFQRPPVPTPRRAEWVRNPVDAFILAAIEGRGAQPSPAAAPARLLRRASLDVVGLPVPAEIVKQLAEAPAGGLDGAAYERFVDDLLASPHFGERLAVPWLDLVRFADSVGYHGDQLQRIFPYRDYVIDSFNNNLPFDRFTTEQIAGDLLPEAGTGALVATGFNRLNMMTREGGAQPKEYLAKYMSDRVRTVSMTWLGSTMGCCECHDHKYDPFSTRDFYSLGAFFADVKQWGVYQDYDYTPNPELKGWSNDHPFPPEIEVESASLLRRQAKLRERIASGASDASSAALDAAGPGGPSELDRWAEEGRVALTTASTGWLIPKLEAPGAEVEADGAVRLPESKDAKGKPAKEAKLELLPEAGWITAVRLEALPAVAGDTASPQGSVRLGARMRRRGATEDAALAFLFAEASAKQPRYFNGEEIPGVADTWILPAESNAGALAAVWYLDPPLRVEAGDRLVLALQVDGVRRVRAAVTPFSLEFPREAAVGETLVRAFEATPGARTPAQTMLLRAQHLLSTAGSGPAYERARADFREVLEIGNGKVHTLVTRSTDPFTTRVLRRGNWQDESGAVVEPAVPGFLPQPAATGKRLTRLDLARWITSRENPLTARVFVNRLWKMFFGVGICPSVDDFGAQGEPPMNPALLDWLAAEFVESGWDVKHMVKLLVMSSTYRQDSNGRADLREVDPQNRLFASQNPRRLEAEFVRDNALAIAGLLDLEVGGQSARPYQPAGYYANLQFPDREYAANTNDFQYRRGVYVHWQRTFLHPMLANFDAPPREECTANRVVSNTPQQALTLLNDPSFLEAARVFAAKLLGSSGVENDASKLELAFRTALARSIRPAERDSLLEFLEKQRAEYHARPGDAGKLLHVGRSPAPTGGDLNELAAWTSVCRVILNLHETITRY